MSNVIQNIRREIDTAKLEKCNLKGDALITSVVRKIAKDNFQQIKTFSKEETFDICEPLLESGDWRERTIAFQ